MKKLISVSALGGLLIVVLVFSSLLMASGAFAQATDTPTAAAGTEMATEPATAEATSAATVEATSAATVEATVAATETTAATAEATAMSPVATPTLAATSPAVTTGTPGALPQTGGESNPVGWIVLVALGLLVVLTGFALRRRLA